MNLGLPARHEAPTATHEIVLRLTIRGEPLPKQRARVLKTGFSFTPAKTRQAENRIRLEAVAAGHRPALDQAPRSLTLRFYRATGRTADLDNLVKLVKDALNGIAWKDDRQVVQLHASRFDRQENPRTEIAVYRIVTT